MNLESLCHPLLEREDLLEVGHHAAGHSLGLPWDSVYVAGGGKGEEPRGNARAGKLSGAEPCTCAYLFLLLLALLLPYPRFFAGILTTRQFACVVVQRCRQRRTCSVEASKGKPGCQPS